MLNGYKLLDSGDFLKFEQIGPLKLIRPAAQAVWRPREPVAQWSKTADACFIRKNDGSGHWEFLRRRVDECTLQVANLQMIIRFTDFGHLGLFPEQIDTWLWLQAYLAKQSTPLQVLNLFGYTGGSTLAAAKGKAGVVHVDASKTSVAWARENAEASSLQGASVRWIIDDVRKFVEREIRRGKKYHGFILDPPSFGRGAKNEVWKIEKDLVPLLVSLKDLMHEDFHFIHFSCHTPGYTPLVLKNLAADVFGLSPSHMQAEEMIVPCESHLPLPSGSSCLYLKP